MIVIDRIEDRFAIAETENGTLSIPLDTLPKQVREGDVLYMTDSGYRIDREQTEQRRSAAAAILRRITHE